MDLDVLKVKFTHSNTVPDKKPYTIYEIEVRSSSTITWIIYKRYSNFYDLHQELTKTKPGDQGNPLKLPHLPPKRLTRSLASEFVEKRKSELQEYLRELLAIPTVLHSSLMLDFLEVPDSVKAMLIRAPNNKSLFAGFDMKDVGEDTKDQLSEANLQNKSYEERRILGLIHLLKVHPNKVAAVKSFEDYFFENRPRFTSDFIRLLFQGPNGEGGLIQTCGDFGYSHVASRAALYLLCRLLDVEKNKDAQQFLDEFCNLDVDVLKKLQLHLHILSERGNRLGAFRIVAILADSSNKNTKLTIEQIVADTWARQEYFRWASRKTDQVAPYSHEPQPSLLKSLSLTDIGYKAIGTEAQADLLKLTTDDQGWRVVTQMAQPEIPVDWTCPVCQEENKANADSCISCGGGKTYRKDYAAAKTELKPEDAVVVQYKKDAARDVVLTRITAHLKHSLDDVTALLVSVKRRKEWDLKFHSGRRLAKLDKTDDVVHEIYKSFSSPYKYRDFILLRSRFNVEGGGRLLVARSVLHPQGPEYKDNVRAVAYPTGYLLQPADGGKGCKLTFIAQLDSEGVLVVSPDLLGETNELRESILSIDKVLSAKPAHAASAGGGLSAAPTVSAAAATARHPPGPAVRAASPSVRSASPSKSH